MYPELIETLIPSMEIINALVGAFSFNALGAMSLTATYQSIAAEKLRSQVEIVTIRFLSSPPKFA
jgi:hypothetical protein